MIFRPPCLPEVAAALHSLMHERAGEIEGVEP